MCTNFKVPTAKDGTVEVGRSLEFPTAMPTSLAVLPSDFRGWFAGADGQSRGSGWTATHGVVGMCVFDEPSVLIDGLNTAGLSMHVLYMPGACAYQPYRGDDTDVAETELGAWLLGTCASTADVKAAMEGRNVWGADPGMGFVPPCHLLFHDARSSIALEFHPDGWKISNNPTSVATNSPYLDWHLTNLENYVGLAPTNPAAARVGDMEISPFGQGQGLMGLPGSYTAPARFVRAVALTAMADQPDDARAAEQCALHVLNSFDIVGGSIKEAFGQTGLVDEVTVWDTVVNLTGLRYAYRTMTDPTVYVVDLKSTDFGGPERVVPLSWDGDFMPVTA